MVFASKKYIANLPHILSTPMTQDFFKSDKTDEKLEEM